ncbi:hypothetical protein [Streptosporangium sp. NPDC004631]
MPPKPKMIKQDGTPVSHFSLRDRKREAVAEPFVFDVDGEFFTMQPSGSADWQTTADLGTSDGSLRAFVAELLGDDYERFRAIKGVSGDDLNALIEASATHYQGLTRGE